MLDTTKFLIAKDPHLGTAEQEERRFELMCLIGILSFQAVVWGGIGYLIGWMVWK